MVEEATWAGDREAVRVLKSLITSSRITVEPKGVDVFTMRNCARSSSAISKRWRPW